MDDSTTYMVAKLRHYPVDNSDTTWVPDGGQ